MAYIDNGDGTITTDEGLRIAKPRGMMGDGPPPFTVNPEILASVAPGVDPRLAQMGPMGNPTANPSRPGAQGPVSVSDALAPLVDPLIKGNPEELRKIQERNKPRTVDFPPPKPNQIVLGDQDMTTEKPSDEGGTVSPEDRVQVGGGGGPGVGGGPPRVIDKGGMRPFQETIQKGTKLPEDLKEQADYNVMTRRAANESARLASEKENEQVSGLATNYAAEEQARLQRQQERADRHATAMQDATAKLDAMSKEYREKPVNQDTYWEEKGQGAKMMSSLFVAMDEITSLGTKRPGGTVATMVDKQINDWMNDKRERRRGAIEDQRSLLGQTRANFESEAAQQAALKAQAYDAYRAKLGSITANAASEKEKATALQLDADLADKALDWKTKAAQLEADHVTVHQKQVGPTVVGGAPAKSDIDPELYVPQAGGFALRKDVPPEMNKQFVGLNKLEVLTRRIQKAGETIDQRGDPAARAELDSLTGQWIVAYKEAKGLGALDKGTQEVGESIVGNPKSLLGIGRERVLGGVMQGIGSDRRNLQNTYGIVPGRVAVVPDGKGGRKVIGMLSGEQMGEGAGAGRRYNFKPVGGR